MRALLILLVISVIALVAGDRVAVTVAQDEIARKIAAEYQLPHEPDVDIRGFPFLTQAVDGRYREIDIGIGDWTDDDISVHDLDITLANVSAPLSDLIARRTADLVAATATATAVVPYDVVRRYAPSGVESISNTPDGLRATGTFSIVGLSVPATVFVTVAPTAEGIEVTPVSVQPGTGGPTVPLTMLRQALTFVVPLHELPLGARLTAIRPGNDGLHVTAVADDVRFDSLTR
ncbi:DUF2993 domain-containing protein [Nocardia lasii]|uniref:DUF2993 domain-containing protein n=1 Tax=Nocardia lasii TaxID=1616107 RepID=A0ABW1JNL0_9NOCA